MTNKFSCFLTQKGRWLTATLFLLFSLGIGQMWGATTTPADTVTVHIPGAAAKANLASYNNRKYEVYFSDNGSKTDFLVGTNTSTTTISTGTNKWCNIGTSVGSNNNNISTAFTIHEFVSNVKSSNNKALRVRSTGQSEYQIVMVVSGYDSIATFGKAAVSVAKEEYSDNTYGTMSLLTAGTSKNSNSHYKTAYALDASKRYRLTITNDLTNSSTNKDFVAFSLCPAAYAATQTLSHVTRKSGDIAGTKAATKGYAYNVTFEAEENYALPSSITVTIGGSAAEAGTDYTWNSTTGEFNVPANKVTGAIVVAIDGEAAAPCGSTAQEALELSANSGTICGTGTTTFTVSGGSGEGALSVSSSDATKATATIDGTTVTVTGVAAGSADITVTKACDATYAEKTATFSATVAAIPTANAGADKTTEPETGVALAADAAADGCTGAWTIQSGPNTDASQLSSTSSATATFTPTVGGTYTLRWTVTNNTSSCSAYDEMTVTAVVCAISDCGNATLTYPIYTSGDLTTSNLFSGATSTNATAITVGTSPAFSASVTVSSASKGSAASAGACYAQGTALTGKMKYSTSSKSSSYYIDFPFAVNDGYTFTPCDVQVVIQPVSNNQAFTVEITDGTNVYGTSGATTLTAGVMAPIIGLTSTSAMPAGDYAIRLYPHGGSNKEFRMGANVILRGTTAESTPPTGYAITKSATNGSITTSVSSVAVTSADKDAQVDIVATPNTGYEFASWDIYKTGESTTKVTPAASTASTYFTMPAYAVTVGATFTAIDYTVTHSAATGGSYTIKVGEATATDDNTTANYGQTITLAATPASGYKFKAWTVMNGETPVAVENNQFTMPAANVTVSATFEEVSCPTEGTVFSASVAATSDQSIAAGASDLALTAAQATVTGGSMSVYSGQDNAKKLIDDPNSTYYFVETNGNTFFRVRLNCELEAGDEIKAYIYVGKNESRGLWFAKGTTYPSSAPTAKATRTNDGWITYTVAEGDGIIGEKDFSIFRATGNSTYFGSLTITRPEKFDVTYYKNDGTDASSVVQASVVADNEFTRSGYRFIEWNTQPDGNGSKVNVDAAVTADMELYAIWAQEYTVSYANTGAASGDAPTNENKYIAGETFKVAGVGTMVAPTDHAFGGWNDGSTTYQEDDDYTVGTGNVSFAPVWNETFNVYYYPNGGSGTAYTAPNVTTVNECFFAPAAGKLFDKWTTHEDGTGDVYAPGAAVTTSINLYAQWKDDECTARQSLIAVTFTGETAATAVINGYNEKEYANAALIDKLGDNNGPTDGGYKIYGDGGYIFATIAKGDFQEGDKLEVEVTQVPASQKLDVYAYGDDIATAYKVVSIEQVSAAGTYSYALTAANATAINALGYKSLGIYRATGSNMNAYVKSLSITGCRVWVIKHDVTFDLNGQTGSAPAAQSIAEGGLVTKPADPDVDGQFFRGWFTDEECTAGNEWDFANDVVGTTDVVLYAKWEADPCTNRRSIVKAVMASTTTATVTGYNENEYAGGYLISGLGTGSNQNTYDFGEGDVTGYKLAVDGSSIIMATLAKGGFAEGDKVTIAVTKAADGGKLPIYAAKDKNNVVSIANIDVTSPGIYTYTLTAANIATIEAAGEGYMSIGAYRGSYNPFIYSVELTGCRNWSVYHTLTFAKEDDTEIAAEQLAEGVYASTVAPKAPRVSGYHFLGWSTTKNDADAIVNLAEYTITTDKTLYAVYAANDCSGNGVMFSMTPVANELADDYAPKGDVERDYSDYATLSGGEVYINNVAATDTRIKVFKTSSNIQLCGGENAYIHVLLDCPLHEDDTIKIENDQAWKISLTKNDGYVNKAKADKYHIVPAAWADKDEFYIRRGGSNLTVSGLKVIRPAKYTVSFDMKGHGIAPADIENVLDGSKITAPTAPTDEDYSFAGWYKETTLENAWDFANDVVNANTTLYAKWLDKSDATLKSLKYGETEIIEVGTYTYNIDLPSKTASVPALTAETNNPNAAKLITNAETFNVDGEATSTVVVTPEAGTPVTYTVNFSKLPDMPLLDVTASTTWNFANAAAYNSTFTDEVLANFPGMPDASVFDAQRLQASGSKIQSDNLQGTPVKFHTTTSGKVRVEFSNTGSSSPRPYRYLVVNGVRTEYKSNGTAHVTSAWITVPAGDVILEGECVENGDGTCTSDNLNFYKIEFNATPDLTRPATPGRYGTICYPTAGYFVGGTLYEIAYYDATAEKIFLDEIINGEMIADRPYVFLPNDGVTEVGMIYSEDERAEVTAGKFNGLHGTYVALSSSNTTESPLWNNYLISNNQYICVTGSNCTLSKNRAYIVMSEMTTTPTEPRHGRRRVAIGAAPKTATDIENIVGGETPVKLMINGQMYILRGEKLYDATGRLVK